MSRAAPRHPPGPSPSQGARISVEWLQRSCHWKQRSCHWKQQAVVGLVESKGGVVVEVGGRQRRREAEEDGGGGSSGGGGGGDCGGCTCSTKKASSARTVCGYGAYVCECTMCALFVTCMAIESERAQRDKRTRSTEPSEAYLGKGQDDALPGGSGAANVWRGGQRGLLTQSL